MTTLLEMTTLAYIAGIIDGEGSIQLTMQSGKTAAPVVTVDSVDHELIHYLEEMSQAAGLNVTVVKKKTYQDHHKPALTLRWRGNAALSLLEWVRPFLQIERKQARADLLLTEYKALTPRNGKYTPEMWVAKEAFHQRFLSIK